ncbi:MAG: T9SS type A sorting domain-containing protein, partial [Flavipsychrobacter sp.]
LHFTSGANDLKNLTLRDNNTYPFSPVGDYNALFTPLNLYGMLNIESGTLNTNDRLTLKSTAATTAIVANAAGTITGMVTIERYIPPRRAWRMINAPLTGTQTINGAWQEGATTASPNPNPNPGYGTHITGGAVFGSLANGFDQHPGSNTSIQYYNSVANNWLAVPNTNSTTVGNTPFMLFIRGDRGLALDGPDLPPNSTTLRAQGNLLTGTQTYSVSASGFTAIPNPYQSPVNFATLTKTNVQNSFYLWDPKMGGTYGVGAYVTVSWNGTSYDVTPASVSPESQYIQPWQSFMVRSTGSAGSITFKESDKVSTPVNNVYRTVGNGNNPLSSISAGNALTLREAPAGQSLRINLQTISEDNTPALLDEVLTTYGTAYSNRVDALDAIKMMNLGENLAISHQGQNLAIERRHDLSGNDTIQLQLSNTAQRSYLLQFTPLNLSPARYSAYLEDSYRQTLTPIDLNGSSQLSFTINEEAASQSPNRFRVLLLLGKSQFDVLANSGQSTIMAYPNPLSGSTLRLQLVNQPKGTYRVALINSAGQVVYNSQLEHEGGSAIKLLRLSRKLAGGVYQLQVVHGQERTHVTIMANQ